MPPNHCVTVVITYLYLSFKTGLLAAPASGGFHGREVRIVSAEQSVASMRALGQNCLFRRPTLVIAVCVHAKSLQSCPTLCDHMDCRPPGSSVRGILRARILQWVALPSSRGSSQPRDQTCVSSIFCIGRKVLYHKRHLGSPRITKESCFFSGQLKSPEPWDSYYFGTSRNFLLSFFSCFFFFCFHIMTTFNLPLTT